MSSLKTRGALQTAFSLEFPPIGQSLTESLKNNRLLRRLAGATVAASVLLSGAGCGTNPEAGELQAIPVATASPFESPSATPVTTVETSPTPSPSPTPSKNSKKEKSELPKSFLAFDKLSDQAFYELTNAERDAWAQLAMYYYESEITEAMAKDPDLPQDLKDNWRQYIDDAMKYPKESSISVLAGIQATRTAAEIMATQITSDPMAAKRALKVILSLDRAGLWHVPDIAEVSPIIDYGLLKEGKKLPFIDYSTATELVPETCVAVTNGGDIDGMSLDKPGLAKIVRVQAGDRLLYVDVYWTNPDQRESYKKWGYGLMSEEKLVLTAAANQNIRAACVNSVWN